MELPIKYDIVEIDALSINSKIFPVRSDCMYEWSLRMIGIEGIEGSAYAAMIFFNEDYLEIARRYRYINDFSGVEKEYRITSAVPYNSKNVMLCYRINCEGLFLIIP